VTGQREHEARTHDFTVRCWGHDYTFDPVEGGLRGKAMGWGDGLQDGDYLLLRNGEGSTRYRIERVRYFSPQGDMWKADLIFAPRTEARS
jgi:hypothetical protein